MSNTIPAKTSTDSADENISAALTTKTPEIRVSPNSYFLVLFVFTFFSAFLIYLEFDQFALAFFGLSWILFPWLAWNDRICFDGKRLTRTGFLPRLWSWLNNEPNRLRLSDVEQIETQSLRALKRGGNVFYRYRTSFRGKGRSFVFASGGEDYRQMVGQIFPLAAEDVLDNRSIEIRDYLADPKETLMKAEFAKIPSADVLESSLREAKNSNRKKLNSTDQEIEKAEYLRVLGNELRLAGYLLQSLEAFRRALILTPANAWILYEFARCLHSFASSERDRQLQRKAFAMLRLAEKRADSNHLLARLGETYFQFGDLRRARSAFTKAFETANVSFRAIRGLAEVSLREGKIAHVIHHFSTAGRLAKTPALRRWTQNEIEYFSLLNDNEEYMEMEISRVNLLETLERSKKTSLQIALFGFPMILVGVVLEDNLIANMGWAVASVALLIWVGLIVSQKMFSSRIPFDLIEED